MYASQQSINRLTHLNVDDVDVDEIRVPIILSHVDIDRNQVCRSYSATKNQKTLQRTIVVQHTYYDKVKSKNRGSLREGEG